MTQQDFADKINISRSNVASIESRRIKVTDRIVCDICSKFSVREIWLRTGEGNMESAKDENEILLKWINELTDKGCKNDFARRFVTMLSELDEQEWKLLQKMTIKLTTDNTDELIR